MRRAASSSSSSTRRMFFIFFGICGVWSFALWYVASMKFPPSAPPPACGGNFAVYPRDTAPTRVWNSSSVGSTGPVGIVVVVEKNEVEKAMENCYAMKEVGVLKVAVTTEGVDFETLEKCFDRVVGGRDGDEKIPLLLHAWGAVPEFTRILILPEGGGMQKQKQKNLLEILSDDEVHFAGVVSGGVEKFSWDIHEPMIVEPSSEIFHELVLMFDDAGGGAEGCETLGQILFRFYEPSDGGIFSFF